MASAPPINRHNRQKDLIPVTEAAQQHPARNAKGRYSAAFKRKAVKMVERELKTGARTVNAAVISVQKALGLPNKEALRKWYLESVRVKQERAIPEVIDLSNEVATHDVVITVPDRPPLDEKLPRPLAEVVQEFEQIHDEITGHLIQVDQLADRRETLRVEIADRIKGV